MHEAFGSDFLIGNTADYSTATAWASAGEVETITPPTQTTAAIVPPLALNAASRVKRKLPGAVDSGQASYTVAYASGKYQEIKDKQSVPSSFAITLAGTDKAIGFNGFISAVGMPELNEGGFMQCSVTIEVDGEAEEIDAPEIGGGGGGGGGG